DRRGRDALMVLYPYSSDSVWIVHLLLEHDFDMNRHDHKGQTALLRLARIGKRAYYSKQYKMITKCMIQLIQAGWDLNLQDKAGYTALMWVCRWPHPNTKLMKLMLSFGADSNITREPQFNVLSILFK